MLEDVVSVFKFHAVHQRLIFAHIVYKYNRKHSTNQDIQLLCKKFDVTWWCEHLKKLGTWKWTEE